MYKNVVLDKINVNEDRGGPVDLILELCECLERHRAHGPVGPVLLQTNSGDVVTQHSHNKALIIQP